jgi:uncharacterized membrane protein
MHFEKTALANLALRLGLAFVFLFAAVTALLYPANYYKFVPPFISAYMSKDLFLMIYGGYEVLLAIWILVGKWSFYSSLLAAATLFGLTVLNLNEFNITFRNVSIICGAFALAFLSSD